MISLIILSLVCLGLAIVSMVMGIGMAQDEEVCLGCCWVLVYFACIACIFGIWGL